MVVVVIKIPAGTMSEATSLPYIILAITGPIVQICTRLFCLSLFTGCGSHAPSSVTRISFQVSKRNRGGPPLPPFSSVDTEHCGIVQQNTNYFLFAHGTFLLTEDGP